MVDVSNLDRPYIRLGNAALELCNAFAELLPILLMCIVVPFGVICITDGLRWVTLKRGAEFSKVPKSIEGEYRRHEAYLFSLLGALAAYLSQIGVEGFGRILLPSSAVLITVILQMLGKAGVIKDAPLSTRSAYQAAGCAALTFLISSRYFNLLFGPSAGN